MFGTVAIYHQPVQTTILANHIKLWRAVRLSILGIQERHLYEMLETPQYLPLFPLNVVLFPNATLPLHVFEERYKLMVQRCLDSNSSFGVALIKSGVEVGGTADTYSIGTSARISNVAKIENGRILLNVEGESRFRIKEISQSQPYLEANVEFIADERDLEVDPADMETLRKSVTEHIRLVIGLKGGWVREVRIPKDPVDLSYYIGTLLRSNLGEKQAILEEHSTSLRLSKELEILQRECSALRKLLYEHLNSRISMS